MSHRLARIVLLGVGCLWATAALAQPIKDSARAAEMADDAQAAFDSGDYPRALARFDEAMALADVPPIRLARARTLTKLGRLVEALAETRRVAAATIQPDAPPVHAKAKVQAAEELAELERQVPRLKVEVTPGPGERVSLTVDGRGAAIGELIAVDPGVHEVVLDRSQGPRFSQEVDVAAGQRFTLLTGAPLRSAPAPAPPPLLPPPADGKPSLFGAGLALTGIGGALLLAGIGTGVGALVKSSSLEGDCPNDTCPLALREDVARLDVLRVSTTILGAIGIPTLGTGVGLVVVGAPSGSEQGKAAFQRGLAVRIAWGF